MSVTKHKGKKKREHWRWGVGRTGIVYFDKDGKRKPRQYQLWKPGTQRTHFENRGTSTN